MEISGQSFGMGNKHVISLDGLCYADVSTNSIVVVEGGMVMAKVSEKPFIEKEARLMYDGMSNVISSSHLLVPSMSFYPDFIQILSRFYPDFIQILSRFYRNSLYPNFIHILSKFFSKN